MSSCKVDTCEYLRGIKILHPDRVRIMERNRFTYSSLEKNIDEQIKAINQQGQIQACAKQLIFSNQLK